MDWRDVSGALRISHAGAEWEVSGRKDGALQVRLRGTKDGMDSLAVLPGTSNQVCLAPSMNGSGIEYTMRPVPGVPVRGNQ